MVYISYAYIRGGIYMAIKLELFRIFKTVGESKSISAAAKQLFISQSAVSQAIKQLEQQVSAPLFTRTKKGVSLTVQGKLLYEYASSAINLLSVAEEKMEQMKTLDFGELKIAASDTLSRYILLPKLELFNRLYPKIKLQIINRTSSESINLVKSGKVDLAFANLPIDDSGIDITEYCIVQDIFVAAKSSAYNKPQFTLDELCELPLILLEKKSNSRRYVESFFNQNGIKISPEIELGSHDLLLEFAQINLGVSCVIEQFSMQYINSGELVKLNVMPLPPERSIVIATLKGVTPTPASVKFLEMIT